MSQRTGWIIVACLAAPFVLLFTAPFVYVGASIYWKWHQGYGLACHSRTLAEAVSPSRQWIARARLVSCGGLAASDYVDALLIPDTPLRLAAHYEEVFFRSLNNGPLPGADRLTVRWTDDHSLELRGLPCKPCRNVGNQELCDSACEVANLVNGITISMKPLQNERASE